MIDPLIRVAMPDGLDPATIEWCATVCRVHAALAEQGHNGDTRASAYKYAGEVLAYAVSKIVPQGAEVSHARESEAE